jgi:hypothetical protein
MNKSSVAAVVAIGAVVLLAPASVRAQVLPSPPWGEPINTPDRFVVLASYNGEAVYDSETGLVWETSPFAEAQTWMAAHFYCNNKNLGNRRAWRLPALQELESLIDPSVPPTDPPPLPAGHPFGNVQAGFYWSATTNAGDTNLAWVVGFFSDGFGSYFPKANSYHVWCVRGGKGADAQ